MESRITCLIVECREPLRLDAEFSLETIHFSDDGVEVGVKHQGGAIYTGQAFLEPDGNDLTWFYIPVGSEDFIAQEMPRFSQEATLAIAACIRKIEQCVPALDQIIDI